MSHPPKEEPLTVDLRTFSDARHHDFSLELRDVIADAKRKQEWYREYLLEGGAEPPGFVGKYKVSSGVKIVAEDISKALQLSFAEREGFTKNQFLGVLTDKAEQAGVLVLRNGKVGANTHRVLDVKEFRGASYSRWGPLAGCETCHIHQLCSKAGGHVRYLLDANVFIQAHRLHYLRNI